MLLKGNQLNSVEIIDPARRPVFVEPPKKVIIIALSILIGMIVAIIKEFRIQSKAENA